MPTKNNPAQFLNTIRARKILLEKYTIKEWKVLTKSLSFGMLLKDGKLKEAEELAKKLLGK